MKCDPWNAARSLIISLFIMLGVATAAPAQDGLEDVPEPARPEQVMGQQIVLAGDFLDNAVFGVNRDAAAAKKWLETHLALQVDEVDRTCALSEAQKARLTLAGRGDIKRFYDRVEDLRARSETEGIHKPQAKRGHHVVGHVAPAHMVIDRARLVELQPEINALNADFQGGIFGAKSIFAKTVKHILSPEQSSLYELHQKESTLFRHRSLVKMFVTATEPTIALTADQRERLTELLLTEMPSTAVSKPYDFQFINYLLSQIPEDRLRPVFADSQWPKVEQLRIKGRSYEALLKTYGYFAEEEQ